MSMLAAAIAGLIAVLLAGPSYDDPFRRLGAGRAGDGRTVRSAPDSQRDVAHFLVLVADDVRGSGPKRFEAAGPPTCA
jgi:hypothetical protein